MALSHYSEVVVSGAGATIDQVGFGTLLLAGYHTKWLDARVHTYDAATALSTMATEGFATSDPLYRMMQVALSQNPRPSRVKIGRCANPATPSIQITPVAVNGATYTLTIELVGETPTEVSITADEATSVDEICDALQAAIENLDDEGEPFEGITVTPSGPTATHIILGAAAGRTIYVSDWDPALLKIEDLTADPGIAADLTAIRNADSDWYAFAIDQRGRATQEESADWAETQDVIHAVATSDWQAHDSGSTADIQSVLSAKSYVRTACYFENDDTSGFLDVAALAERMPFDPAQGPEAGGTFHGRVLRGVTADRLTPNQDANLRDKGYTIFIPTAGLNATVGGAAAGGEFLDYTRFVDWFRFRLQERYAQAIISNGRIPYDDRGISIIEGLCRAQLAAGLASGGISPLDADGNEPSVIVPKLSATSSIDRGNRELTGVVVQFKYAGAIHFVSTRVVVTI